MAYFCIVLKTKQKGSSLISKFDSSAFNALGLGHLHARMDV